MSVLQIVLLGYLVLVEAIASLGVCCLAVVIRCSY